jgi:hypothetical protein
LCSVVEGNFTIAHHAAQAAVKNHSTTWIPSTKEKGYQGEGFQSN